MNVWQDSSERVSCHLHGKERLGRMVVRKMGRGQKGRKWEGTKRGELSWR